MNANPSQHILWAGLLIDNHNPKPLSGAALVIRDGIIQQVLPDFDPDAFTELAGFQLMDLREYTILPGLIDCHVHLALDGEDFQASLESWQDTATWLPRVQQALDVTRNCGVVAVRDGGDKGKVGLRAKQKLEQGIISGPVILSCGQAISKQGRYGSFLGPGITDLSSAIALIDQNLAEGADWIKVIVSGIVSFRQFGKVGGLQFTQAELNAIIGYAHTKGVPVMVHASSDDAVAMSVKAGADSIEHGYFLSVRSLEAMADRNIPWVPTLIPVACQEEGTSAESQEIIKRTYEEQLERIAQAYRLGVTIGVGTDAGASGVAHGKAYWRELELLARAGLSNHDVLRAATLNSARICGLGEQLGSIEAGKSACVVAVKGNPLEDIAVLKKF
jgi:imidazolonepropionase-like amidohydrolase